MKPKNITKTADSAKVSGRTDSPCSRLLTIEEADELHSFLMGKVIPNGFIIPKPPKLSAKKAFAVIYVMQEHYGIIPDSFEMCCYCTSIYDTYSEGHHPEGSADHWCGDCEWMCPDDDENAESTNPSGE